MADLFFYGTLRHIPLLELVLGRSSADLTFSHAALSDHAVYGVKDQIFPMIVEAPRQTAKGLLVQNLSSEDLRRLAFYEGGFDYDLRPQTIERPDGTTARAEVFYPQPGLWAPDQLWTLEDWIARWGEMNLLAAQEVMAHFGTFEAETVARNFSSIRMRAWARLAARGRTGPDQRDLTQDVVVHRRARAYTGYFGMDEIDVQYRQYDGSMGPVLPRNSLMQGAATSVLPYDPVRDSVLLVEQFRAPVFMIDDPNPWMWEPVAGMIDPGETPEQAAHREVREEAGIALKALEFAGGAYASSGSSTEYVYLYVGLADLTTSVEGGGLASEGEDIRSKIIPFDHFMDQVDAHAFKDLPLLTLAHWLARHRDRLQDV